MTVDLAVLESLGINLYSNAAAVLSELVANAYDADATLVTISWRMGGERVIVTDDGVGMTVEELNKRFLTAGYKKRDEEGVESKRWHRPFMGRKGIGKLSVFSIARTVEVFSRVQGGDPNGLRIDVDDLQQSIRTGSGYHPAEIEVPADYREVGTTLILSDLKSKRADLTANALRKRLARRFDVLDSRPRESGGFYIEVNDKQITYADRQELKRLEFIWEFGDESLPDEVLPDGIGRFKFPNNTVNVEEGWTVRGWFGTAKKPTDLTDDDEAGSLKNIIVLARKRPIQEGIIEKLDFSRIFGNYVTGQLEADFLDLDDGYDDIATSDRQRLIEDDERVLALRDYLRDAFVKAADQWSEARPQKAGKDSLARYPKLREWVDRQKGDHREIAERMIGTIAALPLEKKSESSRADLFRAGILAFERLGLRRVSADLEALTDITSAQLLTLLDAQDSYEGAMWVEILKSRVEAISQFRNLADADEKEKVLQAHLFNHLWLLDASWERATTSRRMEESLRSIAPGVFPTDRDEKELLGRIDIRYANNSGKHVIVELKRYSVRADVDDLYDQGLKYYTALDSVLTQQQSPSREIEVVFVLGSIPTAKRRAPRQELADYTDRIFDGINGRFVLYDQLIENANSQYDEYLDASDKAKELDELIRAIEVDLDVDDDK